MTVKGLDKKKLLTLHAGMLFAEHGFDRVTTRMIAESAGVRVSAIHYHFSSKEDLYIAAFQYAHDKDNKISFLEVLAENPELGKTPEGQAEIIRTTVIRYFRNIFNPKRPAWETQLLVREIVSPSSALPALAKSFIHANVFSSEKFCRMIRPDLDDDDRAIWADTLFCHIFLYILARKQIEVVRGNEWLNENFFYKASRMIARFMILELELPLPNDLQRKNLQKTETA